MIRFIVIKTMIKIITILINYVTDESKSNDNDKIEDNRAYEGRIF